MPIIRALIGLIIGLAYGLLVGGVTYLQTHRGLDYEHPGPLIPNTVEMAWFVTVLAALLTGICAAFVGLVVGLLGIRRTRAAVLGFTVGFLFLLFMSIIFGHSLIPSSLRELIDWLVMLAFFPFGLAFVGMFISITTGRLKRS